MLPFVSMKNQSPQAPDLFLATFTNTLRAGAWGIRHLNSRALAGRPLDRSTREHSTQKEMNPYKPPKLSEHRRLSLCTVHQLPVTVLHRVTRGRQSEPARELMAQTGTNAHETRTFTQQAVRFSRQEACGLETEPRGPCICRRQTLTFDEACAGLVDFFNAYVIAWMKAGYLQFRRGEELRRQRPTEFARDD